MHSGIRYRLTRAIIIAAAVAVLCAPGVDAWAEAPAASGCTLRIHVDGFRNARGNLGTVVFASAEGWPEDTHKAFRAGPAPIDGSSHSAMGVWPDLPPGDYAVAAIHDENGNAKLDRNLFGIPKEGFGFANNSHVTFSAPAFYKAVVHVGCPSTDITIHLLYK